MSITSKKYIVAAVMAVIVIAAAYAVLTRSGHGPHASNVAGQVEYTCPMHPFVVKDRPGSCPVCNMELVRKIEGNADAKDLNLKEHVYLSPAQKVMANLEVVGVVYKPLFKEIEAAGVINYDQARQGKISAWIAGRIERLHANTVGMQANRTRPVAELNSPELISAEEEYLDVYRSTGQAEGNQLQQQAGSPLYQAASRLRRLGFLDAQLKDLQKSGKPNVRILVFPPFNGIITSKEVQEGQYVKVGDTLFSLADLTQVWGELDVYEDEFPFLKVGQQVSLSTRSYPGREFVGSISFISPFLDPKTRTARIRVIIQNRHLLLKPEMVVSATIQIPLGTGLAVPAEAVVTTGDRNMVWIQAKPGVFIPREVKIGVRYRSDIQILSGLAKDDVLAASGAYLIDSEAQLKPGGKESATKQAPSGTPATAAVPAPPEQPKPAIGGNDALDMSDMHMSQEPPPRAAGNALKQKQR